MHEFSCGYVDTRYSKETKMESVVVTKQEHKRFSGFQQLIITIIIYIFICIKTEDI